MDGGRLHAHFVGSHCVLYVHIKYVTWHTWITESRSLHIMISKHACILNCMIAYVQAHAHLYFMYPPPPPLPPYPGISGWRQPCGHDESIPHGRVWCGPQGKVELLREQAEGVCGVCTSQLHERSVLHGLAGWQFCTGCAQASTTKGQSSVA